MSYEKEVSDHYLHGNLIDFIQAALPAIGKTTESVTIEDLAPVDEFHVGGRAATDHLLNQLNITKESHLLDVGCGLGGAARYIAAKYNNQVTGIDLIPEYIETGSILSRWLNLDSYVSLDTGSALAMPYQDNSFDGSYMLHVGMNIEDKVSLFKEVYRVLKPGAFIGVYDVMRQQDGELIYPLPWATDSGISQLSTPEAYKECLMNAGFDVSKVENRRDFAVDFFKRVRARAQTNKAPSPLGLHILMQDGTADKVSNMINNITNNLMSPVEIIAVKR
ncbi:class I SAM-dependent methyltransferase [Leucothrix pacifica]|uniref:SAM-dependent methyltransferase n=1 Tax=Leucothrix pacifica TaxID=1247513 RepID=A0A317CVV4_9GAMM|nr:class I SAM-dependent methyltransferase [Leucothrix pacifica]PWR00641.1 SAM-dependent methyltransferase [Leucothrix pacifica]